MNPNRLLHDAYLEATKQTLSVAALLETHVSKCFSAAGVRLKKAERKSIADACKRVASGEPIQLLEKLPIVRKSNRVVDLSISQDEVDAILRLHKAAAGDIASRLVKAHAKRYYAIFAKRAFDAAIAHDADLARFRRRLVRTWRVPFQELSAFLLACNTTGQKFMEELRLLDGAGKKLSSKLSALFLLHARACIVASEIEVLLRSGFADGGMARWRTLHEIAVIAQFISSQNREIAERYLAYEDIEGHRAAVLYQKYHDRLHQEPLDEDLVVLDKRRNALLGKYGATFDSEYGWAAPAFSGRAPKFSRIEELVKLDHLRPYYKLASQQTHATAKGATYRIGLLGGGIQGKDLLLVGPTNTGFTDPAQLTGLSMLHIMTALLSQRPVLDRTAITLILSRMQERLPKGFVRVESRIRNREMILRARTSKVR